MKHLVLAGVLAMSAGLATATLPPPDEATKAKAAEAAAKSAWQSKVDGYQLCKVQDKIAAAHAKGAKGAKAATVAAKPASSAASGTPVAYAPPTPCLEPGPFAFNPPEQKPLETSGAHSPTGTAASPPSVRPESAKMAPSK